MTNPASIRIVLTDADALAESTEAALLVLDLTRDEIQSANISSALERFLVICEDRESALRYRESLVFQVRGYDNDPRELPEIPEVRSFFFRLAEEWPHWLWFLQRKSGSIPLLISLLCQVKIHRNPGAFGTEFLDPHEVGSTLLDLFQRGNAMFDAFEIPDELARASADSAVAEMHG